MRRAILPFVMAILPAMALASADDPALTSALQWRPKTAISEEQQLKLDAVEREAMSYGAQVGQRSEAARLNALLEKRGSYLERVYNFNSLLLPDDLLPPVLDMTDSTTEMGADGQSMVSVAKSYRVISDAKFVRAAPTWRDYLIQSEIVVVEPDPLLTPSDALEKTSFEAAVRRGYEAGKLAADEVYRSSLARLQRDYVGMLLYKRLWLSKMVDAPRTMTEKAAVRGDGRSMDVGITRRVISQPVVLIRDMDKWRTFALDIQSVLHQAINVGE